MKKLDELKDILKKLIIGNERDKTPPEIGSKYIHIDNENPFGKVIIVKVKDSKNGFVLYDMSPDNPYGIFKNESMKVCAFNSIYKKQTN